MRSTGLCPVFFFLLGPTMLFGQVVTEVTGTIDLIQEPFHSYVPVWSDEDGGWIQIPSEPQHAVYPVGMSAISVSFDGDGYYSTGGLSQIEYNYASDTPGEARFDIFSFAESFDEDEGGGGEAYISFDFTTAAPVRFHFMADTTRDNYSYMVSLNDRYAYASNFRGTLDGTFPPIYEYGNPLPTNWGTYIDEGVLPAGTYQVWIKAHATKYQTYGYQSEGTASLTLQLLGDTNLDGVVGLEDLNTVLANWNATVPPDGSLTADLDGDGFVGITDLNAVLAGWDNDVRPASQTVTIPEPVTATLLLALSPVLLGRTRMSYLPAR